LASPLAGRRIIKTYKVGEKPVWVRSNTRL
jgi:hypothetical protein